MMGQEDPRKILWKPNQEDKYSGEHKPFSDSKISSNLSFDKQHLQISWLLDVSR